MLQSSVHHHLAVYVLQVACTAGVVFAKKPRAGLLEEQQAGFCTNLFELGFLGLKGCEAMLR